MRLLRGWFGEKKTTFKIWLTLNSKEYRRFHNIIIPGRNGTTQIDHLLVSPFGLFIVETKNIKGWIFGSENQSKWTQTLYGHKFSFQNPIRQVYRQKKVLSEFLGLNESIIQTVVYFVGDCRFKTPLPDNVMNSGLRRYIKRYKTHLLSPSEVDRISGIISHHLTNSTISRREHIKSLKIRHSSKTVCPKCGNKLVVRTTKKGPNAGSRFLGCENYPKCRFTRNL